MAQTAEKCAAKYGISREEQDAYAVPQPAGGRQGLDDGGSRTRSRPSR